MYAGKIRWTKAYFWLFVLCLRSHTSAGMNIKDALLQNILRNFKNATFYVDCFLYWVVSHSVFPIVT